MNIPASELLINPDGSIYHINLKPEDIADTILLVGDPDRVAMVASFFDNIEVQKHKREFYTVTGYYNNKRLTVLSTGIGTDNIDIVLNELDALVNIDLNTRTIKKEHKQLNLIRVGTSGGLQAEYQPGAYLVSESSVGFDGMLNFYKDIVEITDKEFEQAFTQYTQWNSRLSAPYLVDASKVLVDKMQGENYQKGITISSNGFYGPQGRVLRLATADSNLNDKIHQFEYKGRKISNYEMESSALYGLSQLLGHNAVTVCLIIANRITKNSVSDYHPLMKKLVKDILNKVTA
ncbi:MAG: nucleoside phosphorylase [Bacteroidales bacterium]|nr:nucleoside phosphorylase [Bacteroidales bacterium]